MIGLNIHGLAQCSFKWWFYTNLFIVYVLCALGASCLETTRFKETLTFPTICDHMQLHRTVSIVGTF